jgi:hypothetical protein
LGQARSKIFFQKGLDRANQLEMVEQITLSAQPPSYELVMPGLAAFAKATAA